ncbi:unnamed protein product [Cylindrotheca closterium]|uniref:Uncharacterized protein n=1 Tax=Cylindrotheca closterium TaxID=2856 RepID=A0AAD2FQH7_9STRA|nr:unnamed protein product [Cylindrotheca closterium]
MSQVNEVIDLLQPDDLTLLLSEDNDMASIIDFQGHSAAETSKRCSTIDIDTSTLVPVFGDDESISDTSIFSHFSFDPVDEEPFTKTSENAPPPTEKMISKLNSMMMRSALSRAIVSKTVYPDLKKNKTRKISFDYSSSSTKSSYHKASPRSASKHTRRTNDKISTDSVRLGSRQDSSIGGFLRASKKW